MPAIFTIPKSFIDPRIAVIQRNAVESWKRLNLSNDIIILGDDEGTAEAAATLNVKHIPGVGINEQGTPLLNSAFSLARQNCQSELLAYVNSDIILLDDFLAAFQILPKHNFLAIGRRWDLDINEPLDFSKDNWADILRKKLMQSGRLHAPAGMDYFIFPKNCFINIPAFAVGRVGWDNWMIREARSKKMKIIDATSLITAIHQNHGYSGVNIEASRKTNAEAQKNIELARGGGPNDYTIEDAGWKIIGNKIKKRPFSWWPFWKRYIRYKIKSL